MVFISVGPDYTDGVAGFLDEVNYLLGETDIPHVLTTSYGWTEDDLYVGLAL